MASLFPLTPKALLVPDTEPGGTCTIDVPCRKATLVGVVEIHYTMRFSRPSPRHPGFA